jgi:hypothetical protein
VQFTCPPHGFELEATPPAGRLDGLFCYNAPVDAPITDATPTSAIATMLHIERHGLSGGAIFGIVVAVLIGVALLAGESPMMSFQDKAQTLQIFLQN